MAKNEENLTLAEAEARALAAIVVSKRLNIAAAGAERGWSESKSYKLSASAAYQRARIELLSEIADEVIQLSIDSEKEAMECLRSNLNHPNAELAISAAKGILANATRTRQAIDKQLDTIAARERIARSKKLSEADPLAEVHRVFVERSKARAAGRSRD